MVYLILVMITVFLILLSMVIFSRAEDCSYPNSLLQSRRALQSNLLQAIESRVSLWAPRLSNLIGVNIFLCLILPSIVILLLSVFLFGPFLAGAFGGPIIGVVIAAVYVARIYYYLFSRFREQTLFQLEKILMLMSTNLSSGMAFDNAIVQASKVYHAPPIGLSLQSFIQINHSNLVAMFPSWLLALKVEYGLADIDQATQLLQLELEHTTNQEAALANAASSISRRIKLNQRQANTVNISLITMDILVLLFLLILFYVIPSISAADIDWWQTERRQWVVGISASLLWLSYLSVLAINLWRQQ